MDLDIPSLRFDNRTDFDALHFDTIDHNGVSYHVIVAKQGYTFGVRNAQGEAALIKLDEPVKLNVQDQHYDDDLNCSVRQESDLAPYKPLCDVIVIGSAYAPKGRAARRFQVALHVQCPDTQPPLPERPYGLSPMQALSQAALEQWQAECETARCTRLPGAVLVDKNLAVTGARHLRKLIAPVRLLQYAVKLGTLGLSSPNPWRLTTPAKALSVPLRYEFAQGGQCRIEEHDKAAKRVSKRHKLNAEQRRGHPDGSAAPVAHDACHANPVGLGFARQWYLGAQRSAVLPAPRIERPSAPFTASVFWREAKGKATLTPAGLGFVGRAWLPRRTLVGNLHMKNDWQPDEFPLLPKDFDFRYWNGAPDDQQCQHLIGEERITLTNLCAAGSPTTCVDAKGNTVLRFTLPRQSLFIVAANTSHGVATIPLVIDTVVIDVDAGRIDLVWRLCIVADGLFSDARLLHAADDEQLQRLAEWNDLPAD